ncbi:MAG: arginine--tRNA ligase, partial [Kiritimatiellae bacterium]|nr:arginine--tRNA ligase [Kiritimatiellia bacterium]
MEENSMESWLRGGFESAFPGNDFANVRALPATDARFGDFQCNDALASARTLHMPPRKIAEAVFAKLMESRPAFVEKVELAGPGFLNITVSADWLAARLSALAAQPTLGIPQTGAGKKVVIDYSSPNAAKQMHIGLIRSTVFGNAMDGIFRALGYDVVADYHL